MFPPLILLANSDLLFHRGAGEERFVASWREYAVTPLRCAAYLGASNGDMAEFYDLFVAATSPLSLEERRHVKAEPAGDDLTFLDRADLLLLAGGDVQRGLRAFEASGVRQKIVDAYLRGALVVGVSAGAVQLGSAGHEEPPSSNGSDTAVQDTEPLCEPLPGFRFLPFVVGVHDAPEWSGLRRAVRRQGEGTRGIGIPAGGGAIFHRDGSLEPVRHPLVELLAKADGAMTETLLFPPGTT